MTPFAPDGVYNGIPYRILPDSSIEAMLPHGSVRFRSVDQLIASLGGAATPASSLATFRDADNGGIPANPLDYHSILARAIAGAQSSSAQLRTLVYERARFNLKRAFLFGYSSMGFADMMRHVNEFERAIARIEAESVEQNRPSSVRVPPKPGFSEEPLVARESASRPPSEAVQILPPEPLMPIYSGLKSLQRTDSSQLTRIADEFVRHARFAHKSMTAALFAVAVIGAVIISLLWPSHRNPTPVEVAGGPAHTKTAAVSDEGETTSAVTTAHLPFPIPSAFGVYVLSDNKLAELQPLPISIPDPRVALSAEITKPSAITISDNKPSFILFRRDLLNSAPQKITLRLIARVARQTKIVSGKVETINIEGSWRIRNIAHELKLSPVPGQREMILAQLDEGTALAPGRYAMVLNRAGYDFLIAGDLRSPDFCLEEFEAANGAVFNQCRPSK